MLFVLSSFQQNLVSQLLDVILGHSLGGALATLAAIDLQRRKHFKDLHIYTFGAPRTGNHAFAQDYEELVPHTWSIINERSAPICQ